MWIYNPIGVIGFLLSLLLAIAVAAGGYWTGLARSSGEALAAGVVVLSWAMACFGFHTDRLTERGLLRPYLAAMSKTRVQTTVKARYEEDRLRLQDPAERIAVFGAPLILWPWAMALLAFVVAGVEGKLRTAAGQMDVLRLVIACLAGGAASLLYGHVTRDRRWVRPEEAQAIREAHAEIVESLAEKRAELERYNPAPQDRPGLPLEDRPDCRPEPHRSTPEDLFDLTREAWPDASQEPQAPAPPPARTGLARRPQIAWLLLPVGLFLLAPLLGPFEPGNNPVGFVFCVVFAVGGMLLLFIMAIAGLLRYREEWCPVCRKAAHYRRGDEGLTMVCRCGHRWPAGEVRKLKAMD